MTHIEINDRQVTIDDDITFTMAPNSTATVNGVELRCDRHGVINVVSCEGGSYSLNQKIGHLPKGATVTGYVHRQTPRPPSGTPLPGVDAPAGMDADQFPKINALPSEQLLYMIETVSAAQVMLTDNRSSEAVKLVNTMADQLGIRDEINAAVLRFLQDDGKQG